MTGPRASRSRGATGLEKRIGPSSRLALALCQRGVVLAVSSKNTDEIARQPLRAHPGMLLKEEHFTVFQANWNDKATNFKAIAEEKP